MDHHGAVCACVCVGFAVDLAHKDLSLIMESANKGQVPMPMAAAARESLSQARAAGWGSGWRRDDATSRHCLPSASPCCLRWPLLRVGLRVVYLLLA